MESIEESEGFYFESDQIALKNNQDYQALMKTIAILQVQRTQALKNIDKIANIQAEVLENPNEFIDKLARGEDLGFPPRIEIPGIPQIDFTKYGVQPSINNSSEIRRNSENVENEDDSGLNALKSNSTRHWTVEEQKRLEELLIEYPPEPVEKRRFEKIARALGNRTYLQVASRCQKYFKKLQMAGLPIPGRHPKGNLMSRQQHKLRCFSGKKSTFFPDLDVPVRMSEEEDEFWLHQPSTSKSPQDDDSSSRGDDKYIVVDDTDDEEDTENPKEAILKLAKKIRAEKERELEYRPKSLHIGYRCDICSMEPINGTRWHCKVCEKSVDYCTDCLFVQLIQSDLQHPRSHKFIALRVNYNINNSEN
ncbi:ZZ-type zinc finger-containing protein 3 [Phlebotomus papatasi]|uniref:ZZ-type zinc finger-containing protein 3 n=1 Tax=Phlebotomus papatasi TaxID=29031 RepID=UPI0024835079|nr:ZZ-type zinc finger-containing protein 3 [Phlebotomus papatasi]